jgi:hypothetical protein
MKDRKGKYRVIEEETQGFERDDRRNGWNLILLKFDNICIFALIRPFKKGRVFLF